MDKSDNIIELAKALVAAQSEIRNAVKDSVNPHFKSRYADLASVWDACREPLTKHGIAVLQPVKTDDNKVVVTTMLLHISGQFIAEQLAVPVAQPTAQAVGSAITYARRYGLGSMVGIAADDDDGNAATGKTEFIKHLQPKNEPDDLITKLKESIAKLNVEFVDKATSSLQRAGNDEAKLLQLNSWVNGKLGVKHD